MDRAMAAGFEFVAMGRALLAEPDLLNRIQADAAVQVNLRPLQPVHAHHLQPHALCAHGRADR
jgi:2,4-dienoyl-CoA reductase-like NADH-dependent reductase (Old Yellow Enzyme family)